MPPAHRRLELIRSAAARKRRRAELAAASIARWRLRSVERATLLIVGLEDVLLRDISRLGAGIDRVELADHLAFLTDARFEGPLRGPVYYLEVSLRLHRLVPHLLLPT